MIVGFTRFVIKLLRLCDDNVPLSYHNIILINRLSKYESRKFIGSIPRMGDHATHQESHEILIISHLEFKNSLLIFPFA